jgi:hypothetical protein
VNEHRELDHVRGPAMRALDAEPVLLDHRLEYLGRLAVREKDPVDAHAATERDVSSLTYLVVRPLAGAKILARFSRPSR